MRIRVTTRAELFQKRKQEHVECGYRVEDERPIPFNGFCSFIVVRDLPVSDTLGELIAEAQTHTPKMPPNAPRARSFPGPD